MATFLSPSVQFSETDLTQILGTTGTSNGGFVGDFKWGPVEQIKTVTDPASLAATFGTPTDSNFVSWYSASNFLAYTGALLLARVADSAAINATNDGAGILIKNSDHFAIVQTNVTSVKFAAKYPGAAGNSLAVYMADSSTFSSWPYANLFNTAPGTSESASAVGATNDEVHIVVVDSQGVFSGVAGSVLETFSYLSKSLNAKDANNAPNYYVNQINDNSKYVWALAIPSGSELVTPTNGKVASVTVGNQGSGYTSATVAFSAPPAGGTTATGTATVSGGKVTTITVTSQGSGYLTAPTVTITGDGTAAAATAVLGTATDSKDWGVPLVVAGVPSKYKSLAAAISAPLSGGVDTTTLTSGDYIRAYELFENAETVDVSLIFLGDAGGNLESQVVIQNAVDNIAEARRDLIVFYSPDLQDVLNKTQSDAVTAIKATQSSISRTSSYAVMDSGWKLQYDTYNNKYRWIPLNADIAGLCAQVDNLNDVWNSPGGYTRGRLKNVVSLAFNPNKASRDALYKTGINPVVTFGTDGTVLFGDKTQLGKNSAFSQIGVRRLFCYLEKLISTAAKYYLFEINNDFTRQNFITMVTPTLQQIMGRGGIEDYRVVCDSSNNTAEVVMNKQFVGDIYIKPTYSINYINLRFVAVRQDVSFDTIAGSTF